MRPKFLLAGGVFVSGMRRGVETIDFDYNFTGAQLLGTDLLGTRILYEGTQLLSFVNSNVFPLHVRLHTDRNN